MKAQSNSFDLLRLIAAMMVIYAHTYNLRGEHVHERIQNLMGSEISFGALSILIFFAISGYLVSLSWLRDPDIERFLQRRLLRLVPGVIVVTLFAVFILGPWLTTLPLSEYFSNPLTWTYLENIFIYPVHYKLPGVFQDNPYPNVVNGSIWTLRLELSLYLIVILLGVTRFMYWRWMGALLAFLCMLGVYSLRYVDILQVIPFHRELLLVVFNGIPFFIGLFMARNPGSEKVSWLLISMCALAAAVFACHSHTYPLATPLIAYVSIAFAYKFKTNVARYGDFSYGLYLWGFMVQQTLLHFMPTLRAVPFFFMACAGSFVFAFLSWHFVEKLSLKLKPATVR